VLLFSRPQVAELRHAGLYRKNGIPAGMTKRKTRAMAKTDSLWERQ
jgi:hypothetical protein